MAGKLSAKLNSTLVCAVIAVVLLGLAAVAVAALLADLYVTTL